MDSKLFVLSKGIDDGVCKIDILDVSGQVQVELHLDEADLPEDHQFLLDLLDEVSEQNFDDQYRRDLFVSCHVVSTLMGSMSKSSTLVIDNLLEKIVLPRVQTDQELSDGDYIALRNGWPIVSFSIGEECRVDILVKLSLAAKACKHRYKFAAVLEYMPIAFVHSRALNGDEKAIELLDELCKNWLNEFVVAVIEMPLHGDMQSYKTDRRAAIQSYAVEYITLYIKEHSTQGVDALTHALKTEFNEYNAKLLCLELLEEIIKVLPDSKLKQMQIPHLHDPDGEPACNLLEALVLKIPTGDDDAEDSDSFEELKLKWVQIIELILKGRIFDLPADNECALFTVLREADVNVAKLLVLYGAAV